MNKHRLNNYLQYRGIDNGGLIPEPDMLGEIANKDWWTDCLSNFNEIMWMDYFDRQVLVNEKFPYNVYDPDNTDNMDQTTENILWTIAFHLRANDMRYSKIYEAITSEFNPLYNVDAFEFEDRTLDQTGTDTNAKSGKDTSTKSGNTVLEKTGTESQIKTGNEADKRTGTDTTTTARTTFDSANMLNTDQVTESPNTTDTTTYNVNDTTSFNKRKDTTSYNDMKDEMHYNSSDQETRDLHDAEHIQRRRYGNIGITESTTLLAHTVDYADKYLQFFRLVVRECVNKFTYMVE